MLNHIIKNLNKNQCCSDDDEDLHQENLLEFGFWFENIIMADNLSVVAKEKFEKLEGVIRKIYTQIGMIRDGGLWMPMNLEIQKTLGCIWCIARQS